MLKEIITTTQPSVDPLPVAPACNLSMASRTFVLLGLGFNGFGQLDGSLDDDVNSKKSLAGELILSAPRKLVSSSVQTFHVSISWDSVHVCAEDEDSSSVTGGRWSKIIDSAQSKLGQQVKKIDVDTVQGMVLQTASQAYVARQDDEELELTGIPECKICSSFGVLSDGKIYALTKNGTIHVVSIVTTEDTVKSSTLQFGPALPIPNEIPVVQMACGIDHVLLVSKLGDLYSFGLNGRGQLGHGDILTQAEPTLVKALAGIKTLSIACGNWHNLVLSEFGDVYSFGWNEHGQLGHSPDRPVVAIPTLIDLPAEDEEETNFISIACGERHSAAVSETGGVYTWGWNKYGQLGRSTSEDVDRKPQVIDSKLNVKIVNVYCGHWNTLLVGVCIQS